MAKKLTLSAPACPGPCSRAGWGKPAVAVGGVTGDAEKCRAWTAKMILKAAPFQAAIFAIVCLSIYAFAWTLTTFYPQHYPQSSASTRQSAFKFAKPVDIGAEITSHVERYAGSKVCILMSVGSHKHDWNSFEDSTVYLNPLSSLAQSCEPKRYYYSVYIGYDRGDTFFDNQKTLSALEEWTKANIPFVSLHMKSFTNDLKKPGHHGQAH
jgi:hypothetical protein